MGNILNPTPGDLADRQTILQVKLTYLGVEETEGYAYAPASVQFVGNPVPQKVVSRMVLLEKNLDIQPFLLEHDAIQERLKMDWFPKLSLSLGEGDKFDILLSELRHVNGELWKLEDQARVLRHAPDKWLETVLKRKAETLDAITTFNEHRAELVKKINFLWRITTQEKFYS